MSLLDYSELRTRRVWRGAATAALAVGIVGLLFGHMLTLDIIRSSIAHPDTTHTFAVMDRYYVSPGLGFKRNVTLILSSVLVVTAVVVSLHREIRWFFWERHLHRD